MKSFNISLLFLGLNSALTFAQRGRGGSAESSTSILQRPLQVFKSRRTVHVVEREDTPVWEQGREVAVVNIPNGMFKRGADRIMAKLSQVVPRATTAGNGVRLRLEISK